jgi:hypothetical protein
MKRDIKLKDLIIASFIPAAYQEKIMRHAHWDEYEDTWTIDAMPLSGNALRAQRDLAAAQKAHLEAHYMQGELGIRDAIAPAVFQTPSQFSVGEQINQTTYAPASKSLWGVQCFRCYGSPSDTLNLGAKC